MSDPITNAFELFTEVAPPEQLRPIEWSLEEAMDEGFTLMLTAQCPIGLGDELAAVLFGQRAAFVAHGHSPLVRRGVISAVSLGGSPHHEHTELRITMVPRLDVMRHRTTTRIFSDASTVEVLEAIARDWHLPHELRLRRAYTKRRYITQYRETDFDFLRRITSREGIGFFLDHADFDPGERTSPGKEKLVFFDHAEAYRPLPDGEDSRQGHRLVHDRMRFDAREHHVAGFRLERTIAPEHIRLGDFDFRKPRLPLRASAVLPAPLRSPINDSLGGEQLSVYLHADRAELDLEGGKGEISEVLARVRLEQAQRESSIGRGESRCMRLAPGRAFTLEEQNEAPSLNQGYAVLRVLHRGRIPEVGQAKGIAEPTYSNRFECVPGHVVYRSKLPKLDLRQATETGTVVGPSGGDIHCDEFGRVRVRFHWDAGGDDEGKRTTWLRVVQPWAGANWGSQFIPRLGMEVLVGFLSGDVDQPIVMGAVYNGTHPTPFQLPEESSKAGMRSLSTPGGDGDNEFSFDDKKGHEKIYVHAQRDMVEQIDHDFERVVDKNETVLVKGNASHTVQGTSSHVALGDRIDNVSKDMVANVKGSATMSVGGDGDSRITGNRGALIEGRESIEVKKDRQTIVTEDDVHRVLGHLITVVGQDDARRSAVQHVEGETRHSSISTYEIASNKEIVLRCGSSSIRLSAEGIDLIAKTIPTRADDTLDQIENEVLVFVKKQFAVVTENADIVAEKKVVVGGEVGLLRLDKNARLDGGTVKLNCQPEPPDPREPPEFEPPEATTIELSDESGVALGGKRFIVKNPDKSERSGVLDKDGKAEIFIEESAEIFFPDVDNPRRREEIVKPYVIKQGDYLLKVSHTLGFNADEVWNDGKNAELKKLRKDPRMLVPGDILFIPDEPKKGLTLNAKQSNAFVAKVPMVKTKLVVAVNGKPFANEKYVIEGLGDETEKKTNDKGEVAIEVPVHIREVAVRFVDRKRRIKVAIGHLDPPDTPSGARMRLTTLGLYGAKMKGADPYVAHDEDALKRAVAKFQKKKGLEQTGELDAETKDALVAAHGS